MGVRIGSNIIDRFNIDSLDDLEHLGFSLGVGWGTVATIMAVLGMLGLWRLPLVFGALAILTIWGVIDMRRERINTRRSAALRLEPMDRILAGLIVTFAALNLFCAFVPETFYDALVYHLALPELYWIRHGFVATPHNVYSGIPMLTEMLYGLALPLGGERLAHLINWSLGLGTAWMLMCLGRRQGSARAGLLAALLFYSTPLVGILSWKASVELNWTFYQLLAVYAAIVGLEESSVNPRKWWLMGITLGFAMSTKYTAWPLALVLAALVTRQLHVKGESFPAIARQSAAPALFAIGIVLIWPLRNQIYYGNPIFPFYQEAIAPHGPHADWKSLMLDAHSRNLPTTFGNWNGAWRFILHPWTELTLGRSDVDMLGPVLILGLPLLVVARFLSNGTRTIFLATLSLWAVWGLTTDMARFFLPVFALVVLLYALSFEMLLPKPAKTLAYALLSIVLLDNFLMTANWFQLYEAEGVVTGKEPVANYLGRVHPSYGQTHYAAAEFIRTTLPSDARVLVLGDGRGFGIGRDFVASTRFSENPLVGYLRESKTPEEVREKLLKNGFTHILFNQAGMVTGQGLSLDERERNLFNTVSVNFKTLFAHQDKIQPRDGGAWCGVLEIAR